MQVDTQVYLELVEQSKQLVFFDIESTGFKGDYNTIICVSFKPYHGKPYTFYADQPGNDQKVIRLARLELDKYDCWASYYGKGFDIPMMQARLLKWGLPKIEKKRHVDMYFSVARKIATSRRSLAHLLGWLRLDEQKMSVSADDWASYAKNPQKVKKTMIKRCESDCIALENLYDRTKHLIENVTR